MRIWLDLSIRGKVFIAFGSILLLTSLLGLFGLRESALINQSAADIRDNWLPSAAAIGKLNTAIKEYRIREARLLITSLSGETGEMAAAQAWFADGTAAVEKLRSQYEPMITRGTDDERLMREFDQVWVRAKQTGEQVVAFAKSGGNPKGMIAFYRGEDRANFDLAEAKLSEDLAFNESEGVKAADHGAAIFSEARWSTIVAVAAAVALGLLAGFAIVSGVAVPTRRITAIVSRLAGGDKSISVTYADRKDEIGDLARAVDVFKINMRRKPVEPLGRAGRTRWTGTPITSAIQSPASWLPLGLRPATCAVPPIS